MQAVIQEAVGCDLRGCRPEYDRLQAWVHEVGKISDAGHIIKLKAAWLYA